MNELGEPRFLIFSQVLMKVRFKILGPEWLKLEVSIGTFDPPLQDLDKLQNLVEEFIPSKLPQFFKTVRIVIQFWIANGLTPSLNCWWDLKLKLKLLIASPLEVSAYSLHLLLFENSSFDVLLQYSFKHFISEFFHEETWYIREVLWRFDYIMNFVESLTVFVI